MAGLITSCPRFVVDVALPAVSCIGDRLWGRRCSKGWTRKSNVARFERPCRRNFQRWKKERCKFPPAIRIVIPSFPPFISFIFLPLDVESENFLKKDAESFHLLEPVYTKNRGFRGFGE